MSFANSGMRALELAETTIFDIIVSDMRMPGMDGAELLQQFSVQYPDCIRILLSGHSDESLIVKSIPYTHQFLSKPCDNEILIKRITTALAYRDSVGAFDVRGFVSNIKALPTMPSLYSQLVKMLEQDEATVEKVGDIIKQDPAMSAKLLQLVNSAFFGIGRKCADPSQAAVLLGIDTIKNLVLAIGIFSQFKRVKLSVGEFSVDALYNHCIHAAQTCKLIAEAERVDREMKDLCYLAGMLHDMGKLILVQEMPEQYDKFYRSMRDENLSIVDAERAAFGVDHGKVGAYLLGLWSLPEPVVQATAFHHDLDKIPHHKFSPLICVHVADSLVSAYSDDIAVIHSPIQEKFLKECGLGERLKVWRDIYQDQMG